MFVPVCVGNTDIHLCVFMHVCLCMFKGVPKAFAFISKAPPQNDCFDSEDVTATIC